MPESSPARRSPIAPPRRLVAWDRTAVENSTHRIGLLSDTHGRAAVAHAAVRTLRAHGATMLIHLGDVGTDEVLEAMTGFDAHVVFGNCDADEAALARHADRLGITVHHPVGRLEIGGRTIVFSHGHMPELLNRAAAEGVDYVLHGHTHVQRDERRGRTRIINPGALCRAARFTVAILTPENDQLEFFDVVPEPCA